MQLSVDSLRATGGFSGAPVKRSVSWTDADGNKVEADVYVRRMSYHTAIGDARELSQGGDVIAARISTSIVNDSGESIFTPSDITGLDDSGMPISVDDGSGNMVERGALSRELTNNLLTLIGEVNELGKQSGTDSSPKKNSGTS